jgi:hypothetical protein
MGAFRCRDRLYELRLRGIFADIENMQVSRLGRRDVEAVGLAVKVDLKGDAGLNGGKVVRLSDIEVLLLRVPRRRPQRRAEHIGDVCHRRVRLRHKQDFDRRFAGRRGFVRDLVGGKHLSGACFDYSDLLAGVSQIGGPHRTGYQHAIDPIVNCSAMRIRHR